MSYRPKIKRNLPKTQLHSWIKQEIATIPADKRKLVTTHDAFQYYGRGYEIAIAGTLIGISTEEQPSPQTVQRLVESVKKIHWLLVRFVFHTG